MQNASAQAYVKLMREVAKRLEAIRALLTHSYTTGFKATDYESMALNFRKIAELVVFASLAGNEKDYAALYPKYQSEWRVKEMMTKLKGVNEHYYPNPITRSKEVDEHGVYTWLPVPPHTWLSEDELVEMYDKCSGLIHAQKSTAPNVDLSTYLLLFTEWYNKVVMLMNHHTIFLLKHKYTLVCRMKTTTSDQPTVMVFEDVSDEYRGKYNNSPS